MLLVAVNLRPAVASVGPLLPEIRAELGLTASHLALLASAPVFCFGLFAPAAAWLVGRYGLYWAIAVVNAVVALGLLLRPSGGAGLLFLGTATAAAGIGAANVLVPSLIKLEHPQRVGALMGLYTVAVSGAAAVAAAVTVPLEQALPFGWRGALGVWALLALLTTAAWVVRAARVSTHERGTRQPAGARSMLREGLAWQVMTYFGLQSLNFYATLLWLAPLFRSEGVSPTRAGLLVSLTTLVSLPSSLVVPSIAVRSTSQLPLVLTAAGFAGGGVLGLLLAPAAAPIVWVVLLGIGQGAGFSLALTLVVLRTGSHRDTAVLSAMTQAGGYLIAGLGPLVIGAVHDVSRSWTPPMAVLLALVVLQVAPGIGAARPRRIHLEIEPARLEENWPVRPS